jgi:hypothetical protein
MYVVPFVRLWLVVTGHPVGQQIQVVYHQVLKQVHLPSLGITDMTGGGITGHTTAYVQQRSQMMKKIPLLFLVRLYRMQCNPHVTFLSFRLVTCNIQYIHFQASYLTFIHVDSS